MKNIRMTAAAAVLVLGGGTAWFYRRAEAHEAPTFRTAVVQRGNLQSNVSATGTLSADTTVQVGTQVSGQVAAIYVDFNAHVHKGQLLARIDPTLQEQAVQDAQAGLDKARAQLQQASSEYQREKQLYDAKVITASEFSTAQATDLAAQAEAKSADIALERAQKNLGYTYITAPIDGVVVERNVDVGQTVAASLSAPQLFLIANDLGQMQILASVDESDIGQIQIGQPVSFTVQSYPDETFTGTVKQVRLQSKTQDNVVNYTVVVDVQNTRGKLLPGMTATVQFQTGAAKDVLIVPNAALRFRPTPDMLAAAGLTPDQRIAGRDSSTAHAGAARWSAGGANGARTGQSAGAGVRADRAMLWVLKDGKPTPVRVQTGLTDGQNTAVQGTGLTAGMQVITSTTGGAIKTATTNPLQPQGGGMRRGPGGPGGF